MPTPEPEGVASIAGGDAGGAPSRWHAVASWMVWSAYTLCFSVGFLCLMPKFLRRMLKRGGYGRDFKERFAIYSEAKRKAIGSQSRVWIHAVSVGEVMIALPFMERFRAAHPDTAFVLSTNTSTAHSLAEIRLPDDDVLVYVPADWPCFVRRALRTIRPQCLILTECEFWPNLIRLTAARGAPVVLLNGRLSEVSYRGYRVVRPLFRRVLACMRLFLMQTDADAERLRSLGASANRVQTMHTAKYDVARADEEGAAGIGRVLRAIGWSDDVAILVGASTWPGEEAALLRLYKTLRASYRSLRLVLVPRHFERAHEVEDAIRESGLSWKRRSEISDQAGTPEPDVLLVDSTGELMGVYAHAAMVFVGKSLTAHGGQNMIEPAMLGKPVLFGPRVANFRAVVDDLLAGEGAIQVADETALAEAVEGLLRSPERRASLGRKAREVVSARRGVLNRSVELILAEIWPSHTMGSGK